MIVLVMGATGSGKTTVGTLLASRLGWVFLDADDYHPAENIAKIKRGVALTDEDREPWLAAMHGELLRCVAKKQDAALAYSALQHSYRERLATGVELRICYLKGTYRDIAAQLRGRTGPFANLTGYPRHTKPNRYKKPIHPIFCSLRPRRRFPHVLRLVCFEWWT
jgi:gluconokinase